MHHLMKTALLALALTPLAGHTAGIANNAYVDHVRVDRTGLGYVQFASALSGSPIACGASYPNALSFDANSAGGKAVYALALTAKATGKRLYAVGADACSQYSQVESWGWGRLID